MMNYQILQINFQFNLSSAELKEVLSSAVDAIAYFPGLARKIWIINEDEKEAGGIYFFESKQAVSNYLVSPIITHLKSHPELSEISVKQFDIVSDLTAITRGLFDVLAHSK